jgi:hypothetical protein
MKIEVNRPAGTPIGEIMNEIRSWLDRNKIEAVDFRTVVGHEGIGFEIRFRTEQDAERFQREFASCSDAAAGSDPQRYSTVCRATKPSIGSTGSQSN